MAPLAVPQNKVSAPHTRLSPGKSKKRFYNLASSSIACCLQKKSYLYSGMKTLRIVGLAMALFGALTLQSCKKDPCKNVTCQNGGTCQDGNCRCSLPWEGSKCEVDARDKFVGSWRGTTNCGGGPEEDVFSITKSSTTANRIIIEDIYGELTSSSTFDIPTQTVNVDGTAVTVSGRGNLNGNQLTLTYVLTIQGAAITCTGTYNKQ
jgi:hypothetical protein